MPYSLPRRSAFLLRPSCVLSLPGKGLFRRIGPQRKYRRKALRRRYRPHPCPDAGAHRCSDAGANARTYIRAHARANARTYTGTHARANARTYTGTHARTHA